MLRKSYNKPSNASPVVTEMQPAEMQNQDAMNEPAVSFRSLSALEEEWKSKAHDRLMKMVDLSLIGSLSNEDARSQIHEVCQRILNEDSAPLNIEQRQRVIKSIEDEVLGLGPLEPLLADPTVSDILVNGAKDIYVERAGKVYRTDVNFNSDRHLLNVIDRIVSAVGRRVDESSPMVDARLEDGSRVNAIIPPLALDGPSMSIRRFGVDLLTMENLIEFGTVTEVVAEVLDAIVKARLNVLISGGTGSGKTTMLNVMSSYIPADERIITIEDSAELQLRQPHVVRLETRPPNVEGKGEITARDLVRNTLRMRPERIVVGEVRGGESLDMLQAMNTGHDGSLTTVHANSARDALGRIETMVSMSGVSFPIKTLRAQMASAIDIVIQVERSEDGRRRLVSVSEVDGMEGEIITMSELFKFERQSMDEDGNVIGQLKATGVVPQFHKTLNHKGIELPIDVFEHTWANTGS
jgi:pilus assembly protein CpaF